MRKKTSILLLSILLIVTGCSNKRMVVATINETPITEPLYRIHLWTAQRGLESVFYDYWNLDNIEGKSPEEFTKAKALENVTRFTVASQKAEELGVKLTKEEKAQVKEAAKTAMTENNEFVKTYAIKQKDYETYYKCAVQSDKVLDLLAENYQPNENEVLQCIAQAEPQSEATIEHVLISTKNELGETIPKDKKQEALTKAETVLDEALKGEDMTVLAAQYSDDEIVTYTIEPDSEMSPEIEEVVFNEAKVGEVYDKVIETNLGYEVVKVVEVEVKVTQEEQASEMVKEEYAKSEFEEMVRFADVKTTDHYDTIQIGPTWEK